MTKTFKDLLLCKRGQRKRVHNLELLYTKFKNLSTVCEVRIVVIWKKGGAFFFPGPLNSLRWIVYSIHLSSSLFLMSKFQQSFDTTKTYNTTHNFFCISQYIHTPIPLTSTSLPPFTFLGVIILLILPRKSEQISLLYGYKSES